MPKYSVIETGFFGGILRVPGGDHDPVVTAEPLKPIPSWLKKYVEPKMKKEKTQDDLKDQFTGKAEAEPDTDGLTTLK